jgi:hypothetical protein
MHSRRSTGDVRPSSRIFCLDRLARQPQPHNKKSFETLALKRGIQRLHLIARSDKQQSDNLALRIVGHGHAILQLPQQSSRRVQVLSQRCTQ